MTALNPNPPQSTLLPICHLLEPGEYERRRWKTLRVEDEFEELLQELEEEELEEAEAADVRKFERAEAKRRRNAVPICQRCHGLRHQKKGGEATRARAGATDDALTPEAFEGLIIDEVRDRRGVVLLFVDFFDVEGSARLTSGDQQVGLAAQKGWNLKHIDHRCRCPCVLWGVNIRQHSTAEFGF